MAKLTIAAVILVLAAAMSLTEAQNTETCASKLIPCVNYINSNATPSTECCTAINETVANDLACLCNLYNDPSLLKSVNLTVDKALQLSRNCGQSTDLSRCSNISPAGSVPPPPAQSGSDGGATERIAWTGITSLLLFLGIAALY